MVEPLSRAPADALDQACQRRVSLRGFLQIIAQPSWRLRDDRRSAARRLDGAAVHEQRVEQSRQVALEAPTDGYRRLWYRLDAQGVSVGRDRLRRLLGTLGLCQARVRKPRWPRPAMQGIHVRRDSWKTAIVT